MTDVRLHLDGPNAEAAAAEIEAFVEEAFGRRPERVRAGRAGGAGERADPIAVAGLILFIPGAALAAMDLAERIKLKEKIRRLIALATAQRRDRGTAARLETDRGLEDLAGRDADRVIEVANARAGGRS